VTLVVRDGNGSSQNIKTATIGGELLQVVLPALGTTAAITHVAQATADGVLLASNTSRIRARIYNDTAAGNLKISLNGAVTSTNYSVVLAPGGYIEIDDYTGAIHGLWDASGTGQAMITETTP